MAKTNYEERREYIIPENFSEGTGIFGGLVPLRNAVEGVIMGLPTALVIFLFVHTTIEKKIIILSLTAFPLFVLGCAGYNGDSISCFICYFFKFYSRKRMLRYNPRVKLEYADLNTDEIDELPRDKILKLVKAVRSSQSTKSEVDSYFAVGQNVLFEDDIALEKRLKSKSKSEKDKKKVKKSGKSRKQQ